MKISKLCSTIQRKKYVGLRDMLWNPIHFHTSERDALCVLLALQRDIDHSYVQKTLIK